MFVDRQAELAFLNSILERKRPTAARFVLLYGRRRVGKTVLLRHWAEQSDVSHTYWAAEKEPAALQRRKLFARLLGVEPARAATFDSYGPIAGRPSLHSCGVPLPLRWRIAATSSSWTNSPTPSNRTRACSPRSSTPGTSNSRMPQPYPLVSLSVRCVLKYVSVSSAERILLENRLSQKAHRSSCPGFSRLGS